MPDTAVHFGDHPVAVITANKSGSGGAALNAAPPCSRSRTAALRKRQPWPGDAFAGTGSGYARGARYLTSNSSRGTGLPNR